ncbi:MAG: phage protease [Desulfovibrionaceae bacterium]
MCTALNTIAAQQASQAGQYVALNVELPATGGAPEWVQLIPVGAVNGRDGRAWRLDNPDQLIAAFQAAGMDAPIDWEHATELAAPGGGEAPAAGWITALEVREGALWGRVEWTPRGAEQVARREYRYLSPVFFWLKASGQIVSLASAALTNKPNLRLAALNRSAHQPPMEEPMDLRLLQALGLPATASLEDVLTAINTMRQPASAVPKALCTALGVAETATLEQALAKAKELATPGAPAAADVAVDLNKFVPRADLELAQNRAVTAEMALKKIQDEGREAEIVAAVDKAQSEGKIAPASREFYLSMCRKEGGLEDFEKFAASAPKVIQDPVMPAMPSDISKALNAEQAHIAAAFGNTAEDLAKYAK